MQKVRRKSRTFGVHYIDLRPTCYGVEKMGPLRGDGNFFIFTHYIIGIIVEKMGPLRGDGNYE